MKTYSNIHYLILFTVTLFLGIYFIYADTNIFLRSYATDFFAVIYVYLFFRLIRVNLMRSLSISFCIAYIIELVQYFDLFNGIENHIVLIIIGSTFDWFDLLAYNFGLFTIIIIEFMLNKKPSLYD